MYKLLTVTYRTKSAPYLATRVLQQLATDEQSAYPLASVAALSDFHVDDILTDEPWERFRSVLPDLKDLKIRRHIFTESSV
ncbi:integrase catalytic domain-containing protein, partial [Trichonephila inaurata madagascariensis]